MTMLGLLGFLFFAAASGAAPASEAPAVSTAVVHLADGTQFPLVNWTLSYEYVAGKTGEMPRSMQREARELRLGGKSVPVEGARLEITHQIFDRPRETETGETVVDKVPRVTGLVLTQNGKASKLKPQPPDRKFLLGDAKADVVLPRTVDLRGETLTGTRRELCLISFSGLAECGMTDDGRVVKVEFQ